MCPGAPSKKQQVTQNSSMMVPHRPEEDCNVIAKAKTEEEKIVCPGAPEKKEQVVNKKAESMAPQRLELEDHYEHGC